MPTVCLGRLEEERLHPAPRVSLGVASVISAACASHLHRIVAAGANRSGTAAMRTRKPTGACIARSASVRRHKMSEFRLCPAHPPRRLHVPRFCSPSPALGRSATCLGASASVMTCPMASPQLHPEAQMLRSPPHPHPVTSRCRLDCLVPVQLLALLEVHGVRLWSGRCFALLTALAAASIAALETDVPALSAVASSTAAASLAWRDG